MTSTPRSRRSIPRALCTAVAVLFIPIALLSSACGIESAPPRTAPSAASAPASPFKDGTAQAKPTPPEPAPESREPALKEPVRLAEMADPTQDGAIATAVYFVSLVPYAYRTGDVSAWHELSAPACAACGAAANVLESATANGPTPPSTLSINVDKAEGPLPGNPGTQVQLRVVETISTTSTTSMTSAKSPASPDPVAMLCVFDLDPGPHGWLVRDFALTPDYAVVPVG